MGARKSSREMKVGRQFMCRKERGVGSIVLPMMDLLGRLAPACGGQGKHTKEQRSLFYTPGLDVRAHARRPPRSRSWAGGAGCNGHPVALNPLHILGFYSFETVFTGQDCVRF